MHLTIRPVIAGDLPAVQSLIRQLGYAIEPDEIGRRLQAVMSSTDHALMVGEHSGRVSGLLHIYARPALDKPPEAVVQALVVDADSRQSGAGKALMAAAEQWARQQGFQSVALASGVSRDDAHAFYRAIGYSQFATSHLFRKQLS